MEPAKERRWERLPVPIPVFARGLDEQGREFLEFTAALNISAGGALLAIRRYAPRRSRIVLEIPMPPLPGLSVALHAGRKIPARVVHITHSDRYDLLGMKFTHPLLKRNRQSSKRGAASRSIAPPV